MIRTISRALLLGSSLCAAACVKEVAPILPSGSDDGGTTVEDASLDATADATGDATAPADGATEAEASVTCSTLATKAACEQCCATESPTGYADFLSDELSCACVPSVCGAFDGGAPTDAGTLGTGACTATCDDPKVKPDPTCAACLRRALGTTAAPGACGTSVRTACGANATCDAFLTCESTCP
jgi:hypothetical protein